MPAWPRSCVTAAAPCREPMSQRQRNLRGRSSTKPRGIVSGPDFVPLSGSDHAVSIARSVNASSSHGRPAGCRAARPHRRPGWPPDRCSNGQAVHVSGAHRPLPPGGSRASCRSRDTSRTVRAPLPHHSTACRSDRPSSEVIVCSASPARLSVSRTAPSRSPSAVSTATARHSAGVPGRHVPCAVPPGHPTPTAAPLA
jgi:hypothetical protein